MQFLLKIQNINSYSNCNLVINNISAKNNRNIQSINIKDNYLFQWLFDKIPLGSIEFNKMFTRKKD